MIATKRASPRRPSVALFTYSTLPRGSVVHTAHLADALVDAGCDVTVYALDKDGSGFFRPLRARLCLVPAAPAPATTAALVRLRARELADYLAHHAPVHDIHHAQDCLSANGVLAAHAGGYPITLVRTVHHVERFEDTELDACQQRSIRQASLLLTVSDDTRRDIAATFGLEGFVVGNGVDAQRFHGVDAARVASLRARLAPGGGPVVLAVGGVEPRKNTARILLAFARLRARHANARLWILGGATVLDHGTYRAAFDRVLHDLPASTQRAVTELGVVPEDDVPAMYRLADVLALPSLHEGFGLSALEAMAAGVPVLASATPPFTEFLDDTCATLVDPWSVDQIADGLARALASTPDHIRAGRERARAHDWDRVAARHVQHYERITAHAGDALHRSLA